MESPSLIHLPTEILVLMLQKLDIIELATVRMCCSILQRVVDDTYGRKLLPKAYRKNCILSRFPPSLFAKQIDALRKKVNYQDTFTVLCIGCKPTYVFLGKGACHTLDSRRYVSTVSRDVSVPYEIRVFYSFIPEVVINMEDDNIIIREIISRSFIDKHRIIETYIEHIFNPLISPNKSIKCIYQPENSYMAPWDTNIVAVDSETAFMHFLKFLESRSINHYQEIKEYSYPPLEREDGSLTFNKPMLVTRFPLFVL